MYYIIAKCHAPPLPYLDINIEMQAYRGVTSLDRSNCSYPGPGDFHRKLWVLPLYIRHSSHRVTHTCITLSMEKQIVGNTSLSPLSSCCDLTTSLPGLLAMVWNSCFGSWTCLCHSYSHFCHSRIHLSGQPAQIGHLSNTHGFWISD